MESYLQYSACKACGNTRKNDYKITDGRGEVVGRVNSKGGITIQGKKARKQRPHTH
jgi:hypothetical protein